MGDIRFDFSLDKLINAIVLFCDRHIADLTKLKVAKLLYFADKKHLLEYGRPILGDVYWCLDFGPIPSAALLEMNEAIHKSEVKSEDSCMMGKMLRVKRPILSQPHFEAKQPLCAGVFAASEITVLEHIVAQYGAKTASELINLTHEEPAWKIANQQRQKGTRTLMPYELFFEGAPQSSEKHLARLKADFFGEIIPLEGDADFAGYAADLRNYQFETNFDLDRDHERRRAATR
jgi:uncharacterized phage-associated protein